jgi:hypothetical protein
MFPARIAKFLGFEPVLMLFPVLGGRVVAVFAIVALQCDDLAHNLFPSLSPYSFYSTRYSKPFTR